MAINPLELNQARGLENPKDHYKSVVDKKT